MFPHLDAVILDGRKRRDPHPTPIWVRGYEFTYTDGESRSAKFIESSNLLSATIQAADAIPGLDSRLIKVKRVKKRLR